MLVLLAVADRPHPADLAADRLRSLSQSGEASAVVSDNSSIGSPVSALFGMCNPPDVSRFVIAVSVNPIYGMLGCRWIADVG
jgi:hypothetical protein